ncbi:MAG: 4Fe-4S dicluster domain-containing protein [Oscillospiraceae bacterium]|nr:4Fe-4S dicluster domain-containing protein [Oscillospiraceae bacterium]
MKKINLNKLKELFAYISEKSSLFLPIESANSINFGMYDEKAKVRLDVLKTSKSPKDLFFPQSETLYSCQSAKGKISIEPQALQNDEFVVFGMKNCDFAALEILDKVFLSEPVDTFYKARRDNATIVTLACARPSESCFCKAYGIDCAQGAGDVSAWIIGEYFYWCANTQKGVALLEKTAHLFEDADEADVESAKAQIRDIVAKMPLMSLDLKNWGKGKTAEKFDSPLWDELYKPCLACGTCTFVCPTCQCYDIKDYKAGEKVVRYRCWDSCMYSDFTMMAHGNNRTSQMQRFRQRFMHKLVYFPDNNDGVFSCTGCGRCVDKCPASLNIVKVIKAFDKEA